MDFKRMWIPPSLRYRHLWLCISQFNLPLDIRCKIQKTTVGPQTLMNDLFQLAYFVFNNREMVEKAECTQKNMQKEVMAVALPAQRLPKGKLAFLGQSCPGRLLGLWVPRQEQCTLCRHKGALEGGLQLMHLLQTARALEEVMSQMPENDEVPSDTDDFAVRRLKGQGQK